MNLGMTLRGLTGPFDPDQSGINGRMGGPAPQGMPPMGGAGGQAAPQAAPKGGFFAQGGMGRTLAGIIGDTLLQQSGSAPVYAPMMQDRRQTEAAEAQWSRRQDATRAANREDQQWEWQNKPQEARAPIIREDNSGNTIEIDPNTGQSRVLHRETSPRMNFIPDGMGGGRWVPVPMGEGASPQAPQAGGQPQVGAVIPDPRRAGGPTSQASGTFRP